MLFVRKISTMEGVNHFLQGRIVGGKDIRQAQHYVHGQTLVFTTPNVTVTFSSGGAQVPLGPQAILTQIEAQTSNAVRATFSRNGYLVLRTATPGSIALGAAGTANDDLGFASTGPTQGQVYNSPGGAVPEFVAIEGVSTDEDAYLVITNE